MCQGLVEDEIVNLRQKEEENSRAKNVYLNSGITLISLILQILLGFIVRRLFIIHLGNSYLGYDSVFSNILQMLNIADLGIGVAITSFLYKPLARKNNETVTALMYLYKRVYQMIGVIVLVLGVGISLFLPVIIPDAVCSVGRLRLYFFIYLAGTISTYYLAYKRTLLVADQRSYTTMVIDTVVFWGISCCQILTLCFHPNYTLYLIAAVAKNIIANIIITIRCNRRYSYLKLPVNKKIYELYKPQIIVYVKDLFISKIGAYVFYSTDNLVLSIFRGSILAGYLSNYTIITQQVNNVIMQILSSVQAVYGNFVSVIDEKEEQRKMTDNYFFVNSFLGIFCMLCVMFLIQPFVQIFFGKIYVLDNITVVLLAVNLMLSIMIQLPSQVFMIYKLYHYDRPIILISAGLNIVISVVLVKRLGVNGVLIGTFVASLIYLFSRFYIIGCRIYQISYRHYVIIIFKYFLVAAIAVFIMYVATLSINAVTIFSMIMKVIIIGILAVVVPMSFLVVSDEFQFVVNTLFPGKIRKFFSKYFIWCFTVAMMVLVGIWGKNCNSGYHSQVGNKSLTRTDEYVDENEDLNPVFHLSFDDVIILFEDLNAHRESYDSIFDNAELAWMKQLHERYGIVISCYVFLENKDFSLAECTDKYRNEFCDNSDWLRFGFHARNGNTTYGKETENNSIAKDYEETIQELTRIVGCESIDNVIRLQSFSAVRSEIKDITNSELEPIVGLLTADDLRSSYYLTKNQNEYIYCHDYLYDEDMQLSLYSTDLRVEFIDDIEQKIEEFSTDAWNNQLNYLVVFTHEWELNDINKEKIERICKYANENHYSNQFFEDTSE